MAFHFSTILATMVVAFLLGGSGSATAEALRTAMAAHPHEDKAVGQQQPGGQNDTMIHIKVCRQRLFPPRPREHPHCHKNHDDQEEMTTGGDPVENNGCHTIEVVPGKCVLGLKMSCYFFPHCVSTKFYPESGQCVGQRIGQLAPCSDTFTPVMAGCEYYNCTSTNFTKNKCIKNNNGLSGQEEEVSANSGMAPTSGLSLLEEFVRNQLRRDENKTAAGSAAVTQPAVATVAGGSNSLGNDCTANATCTTSTPMEFGACRNLGSSSLESELHNGDMKPGKPFKGCGFVVLTRWADPHCQGPPIREHSTPTGHCEFGKDPLPGGNYAALQVDCINKKQN